MTYKTTMNRPGLTAIAAVLALSSTSAFAQDAEPVTDLTTVAPPVVAESSTTEPTTTTTSDPLAPSEAAPAATTATRSVTRQAPTRAARPTVAAPRASASAAPAATAAPAPASAPVAPTVAPSSSEMAAAPMTPDVAPPPASTNADTGFAMDDALPVAGAAGLGLLALAGAGMAMRRRRKDEFVEQEEWIEPQSEPRIARPAVAPTPVIATTAADRSAFAWGNAAPVAAPVVADRNESHVDAAYRGPTPDNPFLSLKKRLRRAAFFDQRERAVRAGKAKPIALTAGLPKALAERVRTGSQRQFTPQYA